MKQKKTNYLRIIRVALAFVFFTSITLLFLDVTGALHSYLGWMAKIQFLPAALSLNVVIVALLILLTLVFGRVYCSVICPLGVMQDIISWTRGKMKKKDRFRFKYVKEHKWLRHASNFLCHIGIRSICNIRFSCSVQCVWQDCPEPVRSSIWLRQQPPGMGGRKAWQLCILF